MDYLATARRAHVIAPAGFGKSILLRDWISGAPASGTVWIDLEARDNDAGRLWSRVIGALQANGRPIPDSIEETLGSGRTAEVNAAIEALNAFLGHDDQPLVVVFDDLHLLTSTSAVESVGAFLETLPTNISVILASRNDPPFKVARLRLHGELIEIRERDLRFLEGEIAELFERSGMTVESASIAHLYEVSGGWAAAVRMAMSSAEHSTDPDTVLMDLAAGSRALSDFFVEEVLPEMPEQEREILVSTSILDRVNASIAAAVSGHSNPGSELEALANRSMLTTRIDGPGDWFRYHELFRNLLAVHLDDSRSGSDIRELHRRAAQWYQQTNDLERSVSHWVDAGEPEMASADLADLATDLVTTGRAATLLELAHTVIDAVDVPTISQLVVRAEALHALGENPREVDSIIERVESQLAAMPVRDATDDFNQVADPRSWESPSALPWVRSVRLRRSGSIDDLIAMNSPEFIPSPSGALELEVAEGLVWTEQYADAETLLQVAVKRRNDDAYIPHLVHGLGLLAIARAGQGHIDEGDTLCRRALDLCDLHRLGHVRHSMYARLFDAWGHWRRGDIERAETLVVDCESYVEGSADIPIAVQHAELRSRIRWSLGDRTGAQSVLDRAALEGIGMPVTGYFQKRLRGAKATLDLLDGDTGSAQLHIPDWKDRLESSPNSMREWLLLMRLDLSLNGPDRTMASSPQSSFDALVIDKLEWERIRAHALDLAGQRDLAVRELASSIETTVQLGLTQPLLDERRMLGSILPLAAKRAGVDVPGLETLEDVASPRPVYVEPLTGREQEVLEHMATHLSYPEIAAEMYVSINTVKSHTRAIFRKLAVSKRADAIKRSRSYGLIG